MPQAYLIGGAPRVGKSSLAQAVLTAFPMPFVATDNVRSSIRATTTAAQNPDLFYLDSLNADESNMARLMREQTSDIIAAADRESARVWPTVTNIIRTHLIAGHDILVEGVAILPEFVQSADLPFTVVFLGNQSPEHTEIITSYAQNHPSSWLGSLQPATVEAFAQFSLATSAHIANEAQKYGLPYLEMSREPFADTLASAARTLLSRTT